MPRVVAAGEEPYTAASLTRPAPVGFSRNAVGGHAAARTPPGPAAVQRDVAAVALAAPAAVTDNKLFCASPAAESANGALPLGSNPAALASRQEPGGTTTRYDTPDASSSSAGGNSCAHAALSSVSAARTRGSALPSMPLPPRQGRSLTSERSPCTLASHARTTYGGSSSRSALRCFWL